MITQATLVNEVDALFAGRQDLVDDPYPMYRRMREHAPALWYGSQVLLTRYTDVEIALRDPSLYSHRQYSGNFYREFVDRLAPVEADEFAKVTAFKLLWMSAMDAPEHSRLRTLVHKAFTPRRVTEMRPRVERITNDLIDSLRGRDSAEVVHEYSYGLPIYVIADMLGAPPNDWMAIREWSSQLASFQPPHFEGIHETWSAIVEFRAYVEGLIAERRRSKHTDLLAALLDVELDGDRMTQEELEAMFVLLLFAGHETTTNLISNGIYRLLTHPDQLALLTADPNMIVSAVEELLRYDTNVQTGPRMAARDLEVDGVAIPKGSSVMTIIAAANRDPERFADPDRLDITREDNKHLGFSIGPHYCLGQALARLEAQIAIGAFLREFPNAKLAGEVHWRPNIHQRRVVDLPVRLNRILD
jgi:cytochrome P450